MTIYYEEHEVKKLDSPVVRAWQEPCGCRANYKLAVPDDGSIEDAEDPFEELDNCLLFMGIERCDVHGDS